MKKTSPQHDIFAKPQGMVHFQKSPRLKIRESVHNSEYTCTDRFCAQAALEVAAPERYPGMTKEVKKLQMPTGRLA